jgi:hypothetical protein
MKLTKKAAIQEFKALILPAVKEQYETNGRKDSGARHQEWHWFTDRLCKDGIITESQYMRWTTPSFC